MHSPSTNDYQLSTSDHQLSPNSPWSCLEALPGLIALPRVWRARLGEMFEQVKALILHENPTLAQLLPCPRGCGLAHDIVCRPDGSLVATCCGDPNRPQEIPLTSAEIMPLEVSWSKLRHVLCEALGLHDKSGDPSAAEHDPNRRVDGGRRAGHSHHPGLPRRLSARSGGVGGPAARAVHPAGPDQQPL